MKKEKVRDSLQREGDRVRTKAGIRREKSWRACHLPICCGCNFVPSWLRSFENLCSFQWNLEFNCTNVLSQVSLLCPTKVLYTTLFLRVKCIFRTFSVPGEERVHSGTILAGIILTLDLGFLALLWARVSRAFAHALKQSWTSVHTSFVEDPAQHCYIPQ